MTQRVSVYVDGFNLYYGLRSRGWRRFYWLDLRRLSENLLLPDQRLASVRYFTAHVLPTPNDLGQHERQRTYLAALATLPDVHIHRGYFLKKSHSCPVCGAIRETYEEKMTDVNIAVEILGDAQDDEFDTAIIMSGDSDLSGTVDAIRNRYPNKRVIAAFPPNRVSKQLRQVSTASFSIGRRMFSASLFPERIHTTGGRPVCDREARGMGLNVHRRDFG